jgi:uncharacterized protein YbbK (DUF523 family)
MGKAKVGVSRCLLGERVRYDGDHRREAIVAEEFGRRFEWVVVCPEFEVGFGVPRETLQLEGDPAAPSLVTTSTRRDQTERMRDWCRERVTDLPDDLAGFILKARSPSCGPAGVKLFGTGGTAVTGVTRGLFAEAVFTRFPDLPMIDEEGLRDPARADEFVRAAVLRHSERYPGRNATRDGGRENG